MKTREEIYGREAAGILRDITMYRALTEGQLLRLYPGKQDKVKNLLAHLVRQGRIFHGDTGLYLSAAGEADHLDRGLLACVWVLVDMIDQVDYHSTGDYPAKIIFFANDEVYEIVYAVHGQEVLLSHVLTDRLEEPPNYIIVVESPDQIPQLQIPHVCGYCTVSQEGAVQYYQIE